MQMAMYQEEASVLRSQREYFRELENVENAREVIMNESLRMHGEVRTVSEAYVKDEK